MVNLTKFVLKLLSQSYLNQKVLARLKRAWAKKNGFMPKNTQIFTAYKKLIKNNKIKPKKSLEHLLRLKKIRSLSGIVPVAVLTKPYPCPGQCVYCPSQKNMPKSYLNDEPAVMRAKVASFDPYLQVKRRLNQLKKTGHSIEKIELIVMGGTFSSLPRQYQVSFIGKCFAAANGIPASKLQTLDFNFQTLKALQKQNQTAKNRIIGLTLETRPDKINKKEIQFMRKLGATRVEIGVQSTYNSVLKKIKRGHGIKKTIKATKLLKDAGFKVCYHLMPNLPGSTLKKDFLMFKTIFNNENFKPDMIKIYPCVVCYQAELYDWLKKGKFKPYKDKDLINLLIKIKQITPQWIRINRLGRDIPISNIAAGFKMSNIRQVLQAKMKQKNLFCQCIRCREARAKKLSPHYSLLITHYLASSGQEYFLQYAGSQNQLYALLRLRIPSQIFSKKKHFIKELQGASIIRELHTYGLALNIGQQEKQASQHQGLGKKLIAKAEQISKKQGIKKIAVISGIGAREYYRSLGYKLENTYMVKKL